MAATASRVLASAAASAQVQEDLDTGLAGGWRVPKWSLEGDDHCLPESLLGCAEGRQGAPVAVLCPGMAHYDADRASLLAE
ncbi:hypothetical protein FNF27_01816 [Cafeteria roenbergensis]|nr:hypothetical protein FNF29_00555 [Cafeteria roenbergensis]KAA0176535.1 hypothetical protein FNF27_01816 [Cafeteria roenbergensis]|eukprot:KAA0157203.1 hypothetical protein FNF29_00555 [Cafeteria roenbergensis]